MKYKKILATICLMSIFLTSCASNTQTATSPENLWKKNPVDVVSRYVENLGNEKRVECVYTDIDIDASKKSTKVNFIDTKKDDESKKLDEDYNKAIESSELISVKTDNHQKENENPIEIKDKKGKTVKLYDPITLDVSFKTNYKKNASLALPFEKDYPNERIFMLARDANGDYKILSIFK